MGTEPQLGTISPFFIVSDVLSAIRFYEKHLGFELWYATPEEEPFFAIVGRSPVQIFLKSVADDVGPQPNHTRHATAPWDAFVFVAEPDALAAEFVERDVGFHRSMADRDDDLRGFEIQDLDGYVLFFGCPTEPQPSDG